MRRSFVRHSEPSTEVLKKVRAAREAVANQKRRFLKCPECEHNAVAVFEDAKGHIEAKCRKCGTVTIFDLVSMRRIILRLKQ